ncbi:MAG: GNAT family N-acetyltransferase, partial [Alphaproteobacteria bacterium]
TLFVAERDGVIAAVGCIQRGNEIGLNYVHPAHRFQGVSRALLKAMEQAIRDAGFAEATLKATQTAHDFYRANGWHDAGDFYTGRWIDAWPMRKRLSER